MSADFRPSSLGTIPRVVQDAAVRYADLSAVEDGGGERNLTFAELHEAMLRSAQAFIAAGVEPGDRVGIWAHNCLEWILALQQNLEREDRIRDVQEVDLRREGPWYVFVLAIRPNTQQI